MPVSMPQQRPERAQNRIMPNIADLQDVAQKNAAAKQMMFNRQYIDQTPITPFTIDMEKYKAPDSKRLQTTGALSKPKEKIFIEDLDDEPLSGNDLYVSGRDSLLLEDDKPEIIKVHKLMEQSYFNITKRDISGAKRSYIKALEAYHELKFDSKTLLYAQLMELFSRLKEM